MEKTNFALKMFSNKTQQNVKMAKLFVLMGLATATTVNVG
jgi:hypothetical protein